MTLKPKAGLAASILVGSALAPVVLTAQPAQALDICIDGEPVSINVGTEIIDPNFPTVFFDGNTYAQTDPAAAARRSQIKNLSAPWFDGVNDPTGGHTSKAFELSKKYPNAYFMNFADGGTNYLYGGWKGGLWNYRDRSSDDELLKPYSDEMYVVRAGVGGLSCGEVIGGGNVADIIDELDPTLRQRLGARLRAGDPVTRRQLLGKFINAVAIPSNVTAAGGLATQAYVNDLADTILERLPMRQFSPSPSRRKSLRLRQKKPSLSPCALVENIWCWRA